MSDISIAAIWEPSSLSCSPLVYSRLQAFSGGTSSKDAKPLVFGLLPPLLLT